MTKIHKRFLISGIVALILASTAFLILQPFRRVAESVIGFVKEYTDTHQDILQELRQEIVSQPLKKFFAGEPAPLSPSSVIVLTNGERLSRQLRPLAENDLLNRAAAKKMQDMFAKQYFEHISPSGAGPGSLASAVGYSYVVVGENLAMGSFRDEADLVQAWMESPGHRENILNERFLEIGVAVGLGQFNGQSVWIAVQEFGKPSSSCPAISTTLKHAIDSDKAVVSEMNAHILEQKKALETMPHSTPEESANYNAKVSEYNKLVAQYNDTLTNLRKKIDQYNLEVRNFNTCAGT